MVALWNACGSAEDAGVPHTHNRAGNIIISSVTSRGAGRQQTAGNIAHSDANSTMTREKRSVKEGKTLCANGGGPAEEL